MAALIRLLWPGGATARWMLISASMALAAVVLGVVLLAVSGWLIAASALAGIGALAVLDIFAPGAIIRAAAVGRTATRYLERLLGHEATFRQLTEIRIRAFSRLLAMPVERLEALGRGDTLTRLTRDVDVLDHMFPRLVLPSVAASGATLLAVVVALVLAPPAGVALVASLAGGGTLVLIVGVGMARGPGRMLAQATPRMRSATAEWLQGLAELISVGQAGRRARDVMLRVEEHLRAQLAQRRVEAMMQAGLALAGYLGFWLVLLIGLKLHVDGLLSAPVAAGLALACLALVDAWLPLAASWSFFETCRQAAGRIDALGGSASPRPGAIRELPDFSVTVRDLAFRYPGAVDPVVSSCDLDIAQGEHMLVQGPSGAGKTTLGKLLAGVLTPDSGTVSLGGIDLRRLDETFLRGQVGFLSQSPMLFNDTLATNLRLGAPAATDDQVLLVLEAVGLSGFVDDLPNRLESWIGEHGRDVSGGEGRRLALARLLLADFPVLILDEPMAGVDAATAAAISERLAPLLAGRSVVVLSHDPLVLPAYDRRYSFTGGRIAPA